LDKYNGISVVISTYTMDMKDQVLDCISSIEKQTFQPDEILVVLDPKQELLRFFKSVLPSGVKVIESEGFGLSNARNTGVKHANGEIVAFIDDDAVADKDWLTNIFKNYSESSVAGVGGRVIPIMPEGKSFGWFPEELNWVIGCSYKGQSNRREEVRNPIGCNMSFRRSIFEVVGYFRHDVGRLGKALLDGEEPEFSIRVHQLLPNAKIINDPSAIVFHKVSLKRVTFKYLWKRSFYQGFSKALINNSLGDTMVDLDIERRYLRYLLTSSVKSRFSRLYNLKNLVQLITLLISSSIVFFGFVVGKVRKAVD
jgi:glucosyl-dolichyl phosphate glucuronosyltransferase